MTKGGWSSERSVLSDERRATPGCGRGDLARRRERHTARELLVVGVPRENGAGRGVAFRDDVQVLPVRRRTKRPFVVGHDGQRAGRRAHIRQCEQRELHRIVRVHEDVEIMANPVRDVRKVRHSRAVANHESAAPRGPPHGSRCRGPCLSRFVVANVQGLGGWVGHRVVGEWREAVLPTVARPGVRRTRGGDDRAETCVRDHVRPRERRFVLAVEHDGVLAALVGESAEAVGESHRRRGRLSL